MPRLSEMARGWDDVAGAFGKDERTHKKAKEPKPKRERPREPVQVWLIMCGRDVVDVIKGTSAEAETHRLDFPDSTKRVATLTEIIALRWSAHWREELT